MSPDEQAVRAFWNGVKRRGWEQAVAWFQSPTAPCRPEVAAAVLACAFRGNLERITVGERTLRRNRRRPGAFE